MYALIPALAALLILGCDDKTDQKGGGRHGHQPPHAGTLVDVGGGFGHLEFVLDAATGKLTAYLLDGEAEKPVRVSARSIPLKIKAGASSLTLPMQAVENKLTGETAGDTSQFEGQSDGLKGLKEFDAVIETLDLRGRAFSNVQFNFPRGNEHD